MQLNQLALSALALLTLSAGVMAECPNACSGHGDCTTWDKCECYRNWQAADCSQRTCPYALAHVDTPKGDLDGDYTLDGPGTEVYVYDIYGQSATTQEAFPSMKASDGAVQTNSAHYYMECANKGYCNRDSGLCECFTGYEGHACQRASCPNDCSGHGTCQTIKDIARMDWENVYELWDKDMTMGCVCDPQYEGADCSLRQCKYGVDPLYTNNYNTANMPAWKFALGPATGSLTGTYAIKFYDVFDEDYITEPIVFDGTGGCTDIETKLEALPNSVIPLNSVTCDSSGTDGQNGLYTLSFTENPGALKQIEILRYLDGTRPTIYDTTGLDYLNQLRVADLSVYSAGTPGEYLDYFYTLCEGVKVTITTTAAGSAFHNTATLTGLTSAEEKLLKTCLGDSDGDWTNNVDVENWDYGDWSYALGLTTVGTTNAASIDSTNVEFVQNTEGMVGQYPHAVKLVPVDQTSSTDPYIFLIWWDSHASTPIFKVLSELPASVTSASDEFYVFTTDGKAQMVQTTNPAYDATASVATVDSVADDWNDDPVYAWFEEYSNIIFTNVDASCESGNTNSTEPVLNQNPSDPNSLADVRADTNLVNCLQKGDLIFVTNGGWGDAADSTTSAWSGNDHTGSVALKSDYTGMLYTIKKIWTEPVGNATVFQDGANLVPMVDQYRIMVDKAINWDGSDFGDPDGDGVLNTGYQYLFKFTPNTSYEYVSPCSNRGLCNSESGVCECFTGYTGDNCDTQSSLAV
jgi:hypothetical protein